MVQVSSPRQQKGRLAISQCVAWLLSSKYTRGAPGGAWQSNSTRGRRRSSGPASLSLPAHSQRTCSPCYATQLSRRCALQTTLSRHCPPAAPQALPCSRHAAAPAPAILQQAGGRRQAGCQPHTKIRCMTLKSSGASWWRLPPGAAHRPGRHAARPPLAPAVLPLPPGPCPSPGVTSLGPGELKLRRRLPAAAAGAAVAAAGAAAGACCRPPGLLLPAPGLLPPAPGLLPPAPGPLPPLSSMMRLAGAAEPPAGALLLRLSAESEAGT
jgi:hypothetical protein